MYAFEFLTLDNPGRDRANPERPGANRADRDPRLREPDDDGRDRSRKRRRGTRGAKRAQNDYWRKRHPEDFRPDPDDPGEGGRPEGDGHGNGHDGPGPTGGMMSAT